MSNADTPRGNESHQATREILDELDALMNRMMELPVGDESETPIGTPTTDAIERGSPVATVETPTASATDASSESDPSTANESQTTSEPAPSYTFRDDEPNPQPSRPAYETVERFSASGRETVDDVLPPIAPIPKFEQAEITDEPKARPGWHPLLRINETFDLLTRWLGPVGIVIRSRFGRALLGLAGLSMLVWAVVWGVRIWLM